MSDQFPVFILVKESEVSGIWTSHCLELDVVSQGEGPLEAYTMGLEATQLAMMWDLEEGLDPRERKPAPVEYFKDLHFLLDKGARMDVGDALGSDKAFAVIAVRVLFDLDKLKGGDVEDISSLPPPEPIMRAWLSKAA